MPQTILIPVHHELVIKKSRFIACIQPTPDRASAQQIVAGLRVAHPAPAPMANRRACWSCRAT